MPRGRYLVGGEVEEFACAAGPAGWRYTSTRPGLSVDLTLDSRGRPYRVELATPTWVLRGGSAGTSLLWLRRPASAAPGGPTGGDATGWDAAAERSEQAHGFLGDSPGFSLAAVRLLRLAPGQSRRLRLVEITGPALATRVIDVDWRFVNVEEHTTAGATLAVSRYDAVPLDTGQVSTLHIAGDILVAADNVELLSLDSPQAGPPDS